MCIGTSDWILHGVFVCPYLFLVNVNDVFASAKCLWIHFIFIIRWNRTITFNVKIYGHINPIHIIHRLISERIEKFNFFPVSSEFYLDKLKIFVCTYPKNGSSSKSPPIKDPNIFCCCFWFDSISNSHQIILFSTSHSHAQLVTEKKEETYNDYVLKSKMEFKQLSTFTTMNTENFSDFVLNYRVTNKFARIE